GNSERGGGGSHGGEPWPWGGDLRGARGGRGEGRRQLLEQQRTGRGVGCQDRRGGWGGHRRAGGRLGRGAGAGAHRPVHRAVQQDRRSGQQRRDQHRQDAKEALGGRLGQGHPGGPQQRVLHRARGVAAHDRGGRGQDHQHELLCRGGGQHRPGQLLGGQGRDARLHQDRGPGARPLRHNRQRNLPRVHKHGHGRRHPRGGEGQAPEVGTARTVRRAERDRARRPLPRRRRRLHHRPVPRHQRRGLHKDV
ncbi:MAG: 3-oxoacyl-[acyl-carrier protein] reductase, partial [uncultured Rubrobacteraceae bacterium]